MATEPGEAEPAIDQLADTDSELQSTMAPNYAGTTAPGRSSGRDELAPRSKEQWPRTAPPASSEHMQSYFAQLSDVTQMLTQRASLAAKLGSSAAAAAAKAPPASLAAAVQRLNALDSAMKPAGSPGAPAAAAAEDDSSRRKRRKQEAAQRRGGNAAAAAPLAGTASDDFDTAAAVAGALFSSAAGDMLNGSAGRDGAKLVRGHLQQLAGPAWCTVQVPSSSYKGVEYLTAERRWQAYVVDHGITEVIWLGHYDTDWEAAQAHDMELIRRVGTTAAAPLVNFQSSLASGGSSGSGSGSGNRDPNGVLPLPPALTLQDIRASTAAAAPATAQLGSPSFGKGNISTLQLPTLLPLPSMQESAAAAATTTAAAAAAAFGDINFSSSSFTMPLLDPRLSLSLTGLASATSGDGFASYSTRNSDGFAMYNNRSSGLQPLPGPLAVPVPGVAVAPPNVNFSATELSALPAVPVAAAGVAAGPTYRIGRVQVTTVGPAAAAASTPVPQWPVLMDAKPPAAAAQAAIKAAAVGGDSFATGTSEQAGSMMALLAPTPPPPAAGAADPAVADQQGAGSSAGWLQQQQPAAFPAAAAGAMPAGANLPTLLQPAAGQQGSWTWPVPGGLLQQQAVVEHQGSGSSSSLAISQPTLTLPLGNGSSHHTADMLSMSLHSSRADQVPKISTTDVLIAAGGSSSGGLGLPLSPTARRSAGNASLPCSSEVAAAAAADAAAAAAASGGVNPLSSAAATMWAASHIAAAEAEVLVSKYKGVEYLPAQQKWQAYVVEPALSEVVFLGTYDTELEAAHAHDRELMQRMGGAAAAAAPQLNFVHAATAQNAAGATEAAAQSPPPQQQRKQQKQYKLDANSSALAALAEGPAMAAAMAAVANGSSHDRESIVQIAQAAAAAAATAAAAAAAASLVAAAGDASRADEKGRGSKAAGAGRRRRRGAAAGEAAASKSLSQYKGVSWSASCSKWVAVIWDRVQRKARHLGVFENEEAAAVAYDTEVVATQGAKNTGLNFRDRLPTYQEELGIAPQDAAAAAAAGEAATAAGGLGAASGKGKARSSSSYRGISWHGRSKRWEARAWGAGRQHFVGSFLNELDAARAYDRAILKLGGAGPKSASRLNFPLSDYDLSEIEAMEFPAAGAGQAGTLQAPSTRRPAKHARYSDDCVAEDGDDE